MSFIYSYETGDNSPMTKRFETPIKMLIESESDAQRKKMSVLSQLFNVERSDRYGETVNIQSDFSTFVPSFEGDPAELDSVTHVVKLTQSTLEANKRFFDSIDDVPTHAVCMGIKTIMNARKIILMAYGKNKAEAMAKAINGKIDLNVPASILQLHPDCTIFMDHDAASCL